LRLPSLPTFFSHTKERTSLLTLALRTLPPPHLSCCAQHASEWAHGDLGALSSADVVLAFSHSGSSQEAVGAAQAIKAKGASVIAVTSDASSSLAKISDVVLKATIAEAEFLGVIPTRSIIAQEALVNAIIQALAKKDGVTAASFRKSHPGGNIGSGVSQ